MENNDTNTIISTIEAGTIESQQGVINVNNSSLIDKYNTKQFIPEMLQYLSNKTISGNNISNGGIKATDAARVFTGGSITTNKIKDIAIAETKILDGEITNSKLSANFFHINGSSSQTTLNQNYIKIYTMTRADFDSKEWEASDFGDSGALVIVR